MQSARSIVSAARGTHALHYNMHGVLHVAVATFTSLSVICEVEVCFVDLCRLCAPCVLGGGMDTGRDGLAPFGG